MTAGKSFMCTGCGKRYAQVWATINGSARCERCILIAFVGYVVEQIRLERKAF